MPRREPVFNANLVGRQLGRKIAAKAALEALLAAALLAGLVYGVASGRLVFAAPLLVLLGVLFVLLVFGELQRIRFDAAEARRMARAQVLERRRAARGNWDSLTTNLETRRFHELVRA
jgi:fatty acid desaturase